MRKQLNIGRKQAGYTLTQVMIAILVVGILSVVSIKEAMDTWNDSKPDDLAREVSYLMGEMTKCATLNRGSFAKCDIAELVRLGYLGTETWGDGTGINPYSGDYSAYAVTGNPNRFIVEANNINSDEHCNRLVEMFSARSKAVECTSGTLLVTQGGS